MTTRGGRRTAAWCGVWAGVIATAMTACGGGDDVVVRKKASGGEAGAAAAAGAKGGGASGSTAGSSAVAAGSAGAGGAVSGRGGGSLAGTGGSVSGTGGSVSGAGGGVSGAGGSVSGAGGSVSGAGGGGAGTAGSVSGAGGSAGMGGVGAGGSKAGSAGAAGASCIGADAPVSQPTKTMQLGACTFSDDLGDFAKGHSIASLALGETGGLLSLFLLTRGSGFDPDLLRRYTVDVSNGCKLVRDEGFVAPVGIECRTLSNDRDGGVWCAGWVAAAASPNKYGFRRFWPSTTPICASSLSTTDLAIDASAKIVFGDYMSVRRWSYSEASCVETPSLGTCISGGAGVFGGAVDDEHQFHLPTFNVRTAVVDGQGTNLFSYGDKTDSIRNPNGCTTGVCGIGRDQSNLPLLLGGVDAKGALVVSAEVERDFFAIERSDFVTVGGRGLLIFEEDEGDGLDVPARLTAQLVTGL